MFTIDLNTIDDFRGACAVKGNGAVAGHVHCHVKRVDHDDVFDALLFREETLTRHYFILVWYGMVWYGVYSFNISVHFYIAHITQDAEREMHEV